MRTAEEDLAAAVEPPTPVLDQKLAALRAQASQSAPLIEAFGEERYRAWFQRETFTAGAQPVGRAAPQRREEQPA